MTTTHRGNTTYRSGGSKTSSCSCSSSQIGLMPHTLTHSHCRYNCVYSTKIQYVILLMFMLHKTAGAAAPSHSNGIRWLDDAQEMNERVGNRVREERQILSE